jgi:hypothetical protein
VERRNAETGSRVKERRDGPPSAQLKGEPFEPLDDARVVRLAE